MSGAASTRQQVTIAGHYARLVLPEPPPERPFVYLNMVTSVDGKATVEGTERGLGSADDKRMMQELRAHADAVMNGATTLRLSGSSPLVHAKELRQQRAERGLQRQPLGVIVSRSGELPLDAEFFTSRRFDTVVFLTDTTPAERVDAVRATGRHVEIVPDRPDNMGAVLDALRHRYGVRHLLCEGGPTVNRALLQARAADELFLTLAPWLVAGSGNLTVVEGWPYGRDDMPRLHLRELLHDQATDELYLRYAVEYRGPAPP
jgi:2,5-diamino-6-(ribosylamino)-4(3H)-pyrimidinone 5'-phosphate reductase